MQITRSILLALVLILSINCKLKVKKGIDAEIAQETKDFPRLSATELQKYETAYFASGCFWCVESIFESVKGVREAISGYSGGQEENPYYEQVAYGKTGHAEAVEVYYDPEVISFQELVQVFFGSHDPTALNRQGPDIGAQYRSVAFYKNEEEKKVIEDYMKLLKENKVYDRPIVTQVVLFDKFWKAEAYHQDYESRNPNNSYVRNVSIPRINKFKANFKSFLKEDAH